MNNEIALNSRRNPINMRVGGDVQNHAKLKNLNFENSGHLGFQKELSPEQLSNIDDVPNKVTIIDVPMRYNEESQMDEEVSIDEICDGITKEGVYYIYQHGLNGIDLECIHTYRLVVQEEDSLYQYLEDSMTGQLSYRYGYGGYNGGEEWSAWENTNYSYSKNEIDKKLGNIESALDELHSYAQALISGGVE